MQLEEQSLAAVSVFPFSFFFLPLQWFASLSGVLAWLSEGSCVCVCVCGRAGSWGEMLAHIPSEERLVLQRECSGISYVIWFAFPLKSDPSTLIRERFPRSPGLNWLNFTHSLSTFCSPYQPSAHPSGYNGILWLGHSTASLWYEQRERRRLFTILFLDDFDAQFLHSSRDMVHM